MRGKGEDEGIALHRPFIEHVLLITPFAELARSLSEIIPLLHHASDSCVEVFLELAARGIHGQGVGEMFQGFVVSDQGPRTKTRNHE